MSWVFFLTLDFFPEIIRSGSEKFIIKTEASSDIYFLGRGMVGKGRKIDISIIVVNFESYDVILQLFDSANDSFGNLSVEFIVVDNSREKNLMAISNLRRKFSGIKIINSKENIGYAKGVNLGILKSSGQYLAVINPDVIIIDGTLTKLYKFAKDHRNVGMIGPKLLTLEGDLHLSCRTFPGPLTLLYKRLPIINHLSFIKRKVSDHMMLQANHNRAQKVDWVSGSFMFVSRAALEHVGLMDGRFFLYMEDVDWCRQFWKNGYEVWYLPQAKAIHIARHLSTQFGLWGLFRRISWVHISSYIKYLRKYYKILPPKRF